MTNGYHHTSSAKTRPTTNQKRKEINKSRANKTNSPVSKSATREGQSTDASTNKTL